MFMQLNLYLNDPASPLMEQLILFHDSSMMILIVIIVMVGYMMLSLMLNYLSNRNMLEGQLIEFIWTIIPSIMLLFIALPSLQILYLMEETNNPLISIKAIGHQWYWSYEYSDFNKIEFDSYMKPMNQLLINEFRNLEVDNRLVIPFNTQTRIIVTSMDVIHSWTIPSMGVKIDANPGRLNQGNLLLNRTGLFFGQCSEICGSNHSFMPIMLESIKLNSFINWINKF
uniref:cytochrome c oxidase subunit II n=1 Tax=Stroggylocephalus agrestis TaxID=3112133 RepID=UPI002E75F387|nr:cytochrome c oxidase subunit II [Stroggylocephalus agrestis]WRK21273.1 cytochrome c oxidase subunit II [Stroggylocephalus agrestis]